MPPAVSGKCLYVGKRAHLLQNASELILQKIREHRSGLALWRVYEMGGIRTARGGLELPLLVFDHRLTVLHDYKTRR